MSKFNKMDKKNKKINLSLLLVLLSIFLLSIIVLLITMKNIRLDRDIEHSNASVVRKISSEKKVKSNQDFLNAAKEAENIQSLVAPASFSTLKAELVNCEKGMIILYNGSESKSDTPQYVLPDMNVQIGKDNITVECLDSTGDYHLSPGERCLIKVGRNIKKGEKVDFSSSPGGNKIMDTVICK